MTLQRILVVYDESLSREFLSEAAGNLGYSALTADSAEAALRMVESEQPDVVVTDLRMPHMDGICLLYTSPSPRDRQKSRMPSSA